MSKKILFTSVSVLIVCVAISMSCTKSSTTTSNQTATATTTTGGTTGSLVIDGSSHPVSTSTNTIGNNYVILSNTTYPSISLTFTNTTAPAAGTYTASANYPTSGNCGAVLTPSVSVTWTVVTCHMTVTSGSSRNVSFTNSTFTDGTNTHTVSANIPF